ncbi:SDR family NAD(P)-dependent oxidoreductase [Piscinibacter gummiphilus]|uniref:Dehydrogenase n=1 Tax=Piscinibacter gummiphilus TaxID=946333 RepID=A0A1W6L3B8_9BURK|nr:glucose 1-dehydrogenase [Piscinibacter gummiphilus]ARN18774.1 dehydrogenase [Piscinibacter gummiphilus]ATU63416.1 3-oxoacyl-ACP reductase [Piscinibacter gummiphilus]
MKRLDQKIAVVTGSSRGIGAAIARRLAADGATVAVVSRQAPGDAVVADIERAGGRAAAFTGDVSDAASVAALVRGIVDRFGRIDVLVNNAGIAEYRSVGELDRAHFDTQFAVNTWSVVAMTQAALPHFPKTGGHVVNVSTSLVHSPGTGLSVYTASKAAVDALTRAFAEELGPRGIRVNAVAPHITRTDMTADLPPDVLADEQARTPLGRLAEPEDVADAVAFLASNDARWVTGRSLLTDGGRM